MSTFTISNEKRTTKNRTGLFPSVRSIVARAHVSLIIKRVADQSNREETCFPSVSFARILRRCSQEEREREICLLSIGEKILQSFIEIFFFVEQ